MCCGVIVIPLPLAGGGVSESPLISSSRWWEVVRSAGGWSRAGVRCVRCRRSGRFGRGAGRFRGARPGRARRAAPCVPCPVRFCSTIRAGEPVVERHPAACPRGNPCSQCSGPVWCATAPRNPGFRPLWWSGPAPPRPPVSLPPRVVEQPGSQIAPRLPRTAFHGRVVARRRSTTRSPYVVVEHRRPPAARIGAARVGIMVPRHVLRIMLRSIPWRGSARRGGESENVPWPGAGCPHRSGRPFPASRVPEANGLVRNPGMPGPPGIPGFGRTALSSGIRDTGRGSASQIPDEVAHLPNPGRWERLSIPDYGRCRSSP